MDGEQWVIVPNWERFQHYGDRDPTWVKVHLEINSRADWLGLGVAERGLLCTIWVEFARSRGQLQVSHVQTLCRGSARVLHWTSLNDAGLITLSASKPRAHARAHAGARSEREVNDGVKNARAIAGARAREADSSSQFKAPDPSKNGHSVRVNMPNPDQAAEARALVANRVITEPFELDAFDLEDALRVELKQQVVALNG